MAGADFLETFDNFLQLNNDDNAEWIPRQWVEMFLKKCASDSQEAKQNERRANK